MMAVKGVMGNLIVTVGDMALRILGGVKGFMGDSERYGS